MITLHNAIFALNPSIKVNPKIDDSVGQAKTHFDEMKATWGPTYCVNLIDKKGGQLRVGAAF